MKAVGPLLREFTNPDTLHTIGHIRVAKLLDCFSPDLTRSNVPVPPAPDPANPPPNGEYFDAVAALLRAAHLPEPLLSTLATIEHAAAPENAAALDLAIQRRIPCISLNRDCPLDCALELFFAAPAELGRFIPDSESPTISSPSSDEGAP